MHSRVTAALVVATVAVAGTGIGVAAGASTSPAARACVSTSSHRLALLKHGKCAAGYAKTTLGARGPRGRTGPKGLQGPAGSGATYQQQIVSNDDVQSTLPHDVAGITVHATCGQANGVTITLATASGSSDLELYGTRSQDTALNVVSLPAVSSFGATGNNDAAWDVMARAGSGSFVDLRVSGFWANSKCIITEVAVPAEPAS